MYLPACFGCRVSVADAFEHAHDLAPRGWRNVDPVYRVGGGGGPLGGRNYFCDLLKKCFQ
jgi:hypothetical protein